jgi:hypothetical protein
MPSAARRLVPVALATSLFTACQGDGLCFCEPPPVLTMNPASLAMVAGDSAQLTVTTTQNGETVTGYVPVTVTARPMP